VLRFVSLYLRTNMQESAWVLSNIAAGSIEHKKLIFSSEAMPLLIHLLSTSPFDIKKEVAYTLANLCVSPSEGAGQPNIILDHLVSLVKHGCLPGFINLVRSADIEGARLGLQFLEIVSKTYLFDLCDTCGFYFILDKLLPD